MLTCILLIGLWNDRPGEAVRKPANIAGIDSRGSVRSAKVHIDRALSSEDRGDPADRARNLAKAMLTDPDDVMSRGLAGYVRYRGEWIKPDRIADRIDRSSELSLIYQQYDILRSKTRNTADDQWKTAVWCEDHGLIDEAKGRYLVAGTLDPARSAAWNKIGYKEYRGVWIPASNYKRYVRDEIIRRKTDEVWTARLSRWKSWLGSSKTRDRALMYLSAVDDPLSVAAVRKILIPGDALAQTEAMKILSNIDTCESAQTLALLIPFGKSDEIVRNAGDNLKKRDPSDYLPFLIDKIMPGYKYIYKFSSGPGDPGELLVDFGAFYLRRYYEPAPMLTKEDYEIINQFGGSVFDSSATGFLTASDLAVWNRIGPPLFHNGIKIAAGVRSYGILGRNFYANLAENERSRISSLESLGGDILKIGNYNQTFYKYNRRIVDHLIKISGKDFGLDRKEWLRWHYRYIAHSNYADSIKESVKPMFIQFTPLAYRPSYSRSVISLQESSCFALGTIVKTARGDRAVETLNSGDLVLSQDVESGELSFQPVLRPIQNTPQPTLEIDLGVDKITSTEIHRFWIAGKGWAPARDLHKGDRIRALGALLVVRSVESRPVQPVFNLVVAANHDYCVGRSGALVHDNDYAPRVEQPFDRVRLEAVESSIRNKR